jgi:hypothetical protein
VNRRWAPPALVTAAVFAVHAVLVWPVHGFMLSDTTGYLANARWLAGEAGRTWQGPTSFYHPGWSFLVAPAYVLFDRPRNVQVAALVINAVLAAAIVPAAFVMARRAFRLPDRVALAGAAVAATYPAVLLLAGYEWGEALYQLLFVLFVLTVALAHERPTIANTVAVGALAAGMNATHPRGLGMIAVAGAWLIVLAWRHRVALAGLGALLVLFAATRVLDQVLLDAIYSSRSAAVEGDVLGRLTDLHLLWGAVKATIGQLWYLTVASFGLVPIGALWLATSKRIPRTVGWVTLAAVVATLGASALEMSDGYRVDHMVYGRYMEGVVPAILVAGVAAIVAWRSVLVRLLAAVAGGATALALVLVVIRGGDVFTGNVMPLNVTGILVYKSSISVVDIARATLLALVLTTALWLVARWRPIVGVSALALVFVASSASVQARTLDPFDETFAAMTRIPDVVRDVSDRAVIGYDRAAYDKEAANFYQLELADYGVRFFDSRRTRPAADLVISSPDWTRAEAWGARLVTVETGDYEQALWVMPGLVQDRLVSNGDVLPRDPAVRMPEPATRQRIDVDVPSSMSRGKTVTVDLDVTHTGTALGWRPGFVRLVARWDDGTAQAVDLDRAVLPGHSATFELRLVAPSTAGRHTVTIGLEQFEDTPFTPRPQFTVVVR